ncbi:MAG: helix-turn-helix transcriptional regulator [Elainella sp. C42_A2020_010]|nr:helix-turn-helix transcriptional regulator [Elainella sp. C42_A2020_010]
MLELAQQVGISERTLQRGFRAVFQTTVQGYLKQQWLKQAERLLRQGNYTVPEAANLVGYGHLRHFAAAFKRQFNPMQWLNYNPRTNLCRRIPFIDRQRQR